MPVDIRQLGIDQLSVEDRLELIEQIWESLPREVDADGIPAWHRTLIEQRLAEAEASPGQGEPWRKVIARLREG